MDNKFFKSTIILIIGGLVTKLLGFIIKIICTRIIGQDGITLYSLIMPTFSLVIAIVTFSLPLSISKIISENKYNNSDVIKSAKTIVFFIDIIIIFLLLLSKGFIANNLLHEPKTNPLILSIIFTIPFISFSSIYKGYFLGKQNPFPNCISNIFEQLLRITIIILLFPAIAKKSNTLAVCSIIILNVFQEILSIAIFKFFMRNHNISRGNISKTISKQVFKLSIPNVIGRLIGNIGYFFEPIIITKSAIMCNQSLQLAKKHYGIYNAFSIPLLSMPSFFIVAISNSLLPELSRFYVIKDKEMIFKRFCQAIFLTFGIGFVFSFLILIFREKLLFVLYKTNSGSEFIKILAPFFVLFYLEGPLSVTLQAIDKIKESFIITSFGVVVKNLFLLIFSLKGFGIISLVYAEIINIFFVTLLSFYFIIHYFKSADCV